MSQVLGDVSAADQFVDRREGRASVASLGRERRQFADGHAEFTPPAKELAEAIDQYKVRHRRRFITYEEMLDVITTLGYHK